MFKSGIICPGEEWILGIGFTSLSSWGKYKLWVQVYCVNRRFGPKNSGGDGGNWVNFGVI